MSESTKYYIEFAAKAFMLALAATLIIAAGIGLALIAITIGA